MTYLCVPIFVRDVAGARADIARAAEGGADLVELRLDFITDFSIVAELLRNPLIPIIVTCRPTWEGGYSEMEDEGRLQMLCEADNAAYFDVEMNTPPQLRNLFIRSTKTATTAARIILSYHDFQSRPDRLYNILTEMSQIPADITKIVWLARTIRDNIEAFEILQRRDRPTIALCMGEAGIVSRILAKKFGAFLTFAALSSSTGTAPGQITLDDFKRLYRWDAINSRTKIFGVVASPVMHSMSPAIHNAAFDATNFDGVYLPLLVEGSYESFKAFMESFIAFAPLDLTGLSITLPHKENALRYLKEKNAEIEPLAERIGAINTIRIERNGDEIKLAGRNTDYAAILDAITDAMKIDRLALAKMRIAVIGAGGTGRTAVAALAHCGATVVVYNRTKERADALADEFNGQSGKVVAAAMDKLCQSCCTIFINTTSVGMHPNVDASPFDGQAIPFTKDSVMFDAVYNPAQTKLLGQAQAAGATTIGGIEMFLRQAAAQFEWWTRTPAPREVMRDVIESRLNMAQKK